ncbi:hypothetical protein BHE74_00003908 [Ensete ventricosum]|nr:hypothetical protein BHE74_00003908 [Ensete ventricosum]RZR81507.1 hypothetical protein BHM03_00007754 [Ensete ventricosum]
MGKHKSRRGEGSSRVPSRDKEPIAPNDRPTFPVYRRPKSMKELCGTTICKDDKGYYALHMTDLPPRDSGSAM